MLDFTFTEEQELFRRIVREFSQKKIAPIVRDIEEKERIPNDVIKGMAELNLMGITASPEFGCAGADPILAGIAGEELGRADITCATAVFYLVPASWGHVLNTYGKKETKQKVFPSLSKGKSFLGIATTEPEAGSDLAGMKTVAKRVGDEYVINGEKMYISGVKEVMEQLEEGGGFLTLVKTAPEKGTKGMSFLYVPLKGTPGVSYTILDDMGRRGISTGGFKMDNVHVPVSNLVGEENKGFYIAMEGFDYARAIIAAVCSGAAMSTLEQGMEYIKQRKAFGQPIAKYEGVQFKLGGGLFKDGCSSTFGLQSALDAGEGDQGEEVLQVRSLKGNCRGKDARTSVDFRYNKRCSPVVRSVRIQQRVSDRGWSQRSQILHVG